MAQLFNFSCKGYTLPMRVVQIFLAVLIVIGLGLLASQKLWVPSLVDFIINSEAEQASATIGDLCHETQSYYGVERHVGDSAITHILVKYKTSPSQHFSCLYIVGRGDFEITNDQPDYLLSFTNHFLIIDRGTAPEPRELIVYDLRSRRQVYTDRYASPWRVLNDTLTYWSPVEAKPTLATCPLLSQYTQDGLGAVIETHVELDLTTLTKKDLGESRCMPTQ